MSEVGEKNKRVSRNTINRSSGEPTVEEELATLKAELSEIKKQIKDNAEDLKANKIEKAEARSEKREGRLDNLLVSEKELRIEKRKLDEAKVILLKEINKLSQRTGTSSMEAALLRFAEICKSRSRKLVTKDYDSSSILDSGNKLKTKLRVYGLPPDMIWPMFLVGKQRSVKCRNLYFCRMTPADIKRRAVTLQFLRTDKLNAVWIGFPGIGKSADMNYILMKLLTHIGEAGWPAIVAFRFDAFIAEFRYDSSSSLTTISWHQGKKVMDIRSYTRKVKDTGVPAAIVVELGESEADPDPFIPMAIALSSTDVDRKLKTLLKGHDHLSMLISPPTVAEIQLMVQAELASNSHTSLFKALTINQAMAEVRRRSDIVGPIPRYVIAPESSFLKRKFLLDANQAYSQFFSQLKNLDYNNVPEGVKLCVAPFLKYGVENPQLHLSYGVAITQKVKNVPSPSELKGPIYEFKFLSDYIALNVAKEATNDNKEIEALKLYHLDYLLAEAVIKYGVLEASMRPEVSSVFWDMSHWEWHADPGYQSLLDTTTVITSTTSIPTIPPCFREINFSGVYLKKPAKELEAGVLYRSLSLNMAVGEFLTVDHATKTVFMFQVTLSDIKDYPFKASTIENVMTSLNIINTNDRRSSKYTFHLLCFADWSMEETHGSKIIVKSSAQSKVDFARIKSNIIRACIWPARPKILLQNKKALLKSKKILPLVDPRLYLEKDQQPIIPRTVKRGKAIDPRTAKRGKAISRRRI